MFGIKMTASRISHVSIKLISTNSKIDGIPSICTILSPAYGESTFRKYYQRNYLRLVQTKHLDRLLFTGFTKFQKWHIKVNHFLYMLIDILNMICTLLCQKLLNDKPQRLPRWRWFCFIRCCAILQVIHFF